MTLYLMSIVLFVLFVNIYEIFEIAVLHDLDSTVRIDQDQNNMHSQKPRYDYVCWQRFAIYVTTYEIIEIT